MSKRGIPDGAVVRGTDKGYVHGDLKPGSERPVEKVEKTYPYMRPRDAATLILVRMKGKTPEVLMGCRAAAHAFMPNRYVFPGGRVDPADHPEPGSVLPPHAFSDLSDAEEAAYRQAAVREVLEEANVAIAPADLAPLAHWVTPEIEIRRYDTRFFLARLPGAHPDNVAMALAVAAYAGVDRETAVRGMEIASVEPLPTLPVTAMIDGIEWWYRDIGSINDTDSLTPALVGAKAQMPSDAVTLAILTTRWDRPLRAIQFAASITPADVDGIVIVGEPDVVVRHYAHQAGWTNDRIVRIGTWGYGERPLYRRMAELAERVRGEWPRSIALIGLENNHQYVADLIREKMFGKDVL